MEELIRDIQYQFRKEVVNVKEKGLLEKIIIKYLGKNGLINQLFKKVTASSVDKKPYYGRLANELKHEIITQIEKKKDEILSHIEKGSFIDLTLPGRKFPIGKAHPVSIVLDEIEEIFAQMGFTVYYGPEVETEYYNFEALNMQKHHPARDMWSTFYLPEGKLLRTHTSPVQIRMMEKEKPPIAMIAPGKCFRRDNLDASHSSVFHQVEGLLVDERVKFSHLKGVLTTFAKNMFNKEVVLRFRPSYFPFTEPSVEVDIRCAICSGKGCSVCGGNGWLEILGAGMVNPAVFEKVGYDPNIYTGFAFGMGVERIAMLRAGIDDIRLFFENDIRFLEQF